MYIVTDSDFRQKVILNRMDFDDKVIKIASKGLIYVNEDDFLFNAQLTMAKHGLKRVVVQNDKKEIVGILDQISLSSFFATNTFSVSNQIVKAEETLDAKKEQNDASKLQNLSLQDQVNFSTLTINIYQDESIKQEMVANEKSINAYRPNIGLQIWDSIKTGWFILEHIVSFVVVLWPFVLIGFLGFLVYKKFLKK